MPDSHNDINQLNKHVHTNREKRHTVTFRTGQVRRRSLQFSWSYREKFPWTWSYVRMTRQFVPVSCFGACILIDFLHSVFCTVYIFRNFMTFDRTCGSFIFALVKADKELTFYILTL